MINKLLLIPDSHVKPGDTFNHLDHIGCLIADEQPEVVLHVGDFADMISLCSYDRGRKSFEGRRYKDDVEASIEGMTVLLAPLRALQEKQRKNKERVYKPRMVMCAGNHDQARIRRAVDMDAILEGTMSYEDLKYAELGWECHDFLEIVEVEGVSFSHYFTSGSMGKPVSSARALLQKKFGSCVMGHVQHRDISYAYRPDGTLITGLFCGTSYPQEADYLGPQGNHHFRGCWILKDMEQGQFEAVPYTLKEIELRFS